MGLGYGSSDEYLRSLEQLGELYDAEKKVEEEDVRLKGSTERTSTAILDYSVQVGRAVEQTNALAQSVERASGVMRLETDAVLANTKAWEANVAAQLAAADATSRVGHGTAVGGAERLAVSGASAPIVERARTVERQAYSAAPVAREAPHSAYPNEAPARYESALQGQAAAEARAKADAAAYTASVRPGSGKSTGEQAGLLGAREASAQAAQAAKVETQAAQANLQAQKAALAAAEKQVQAEAELAAAQQRDAAAISAASTRTQARRVGEAGAAVGATSAAPRQLGPGRPTTHLGPATGTVESAGTTAAPQGAVFEREQRAAQQAAVAEREAADALAVYRAEAQSAGAAVTELAAAQGKANLAYNQSVAAYAGSSSVLTRNGALTTEFIQAFARGDVTLKEFSSQMVSTIGKFGGWVVAAAAVYGVFDAVKKLGEGAAQTQQGVQQLSRFIPGATTGSTRGQLEGTFRDISQQMNVPISEVTSAMGIMARVFHNVADAGEATRAVLLASRLDQIPQAQSEQYFTGIAQSEGFTHGSQLVDVVNSLNALQNVAGARVSQTLPALARTAPIAEASGIPLNQLEALIAIGVRAGVPGLQLATAITQSAATYAYRPQSVATLRSYGLDPVRGQYGNLIGQVEQKITNPKPGKELSYTDVGAIATALGGQRGNRFLLPLLEHLNQLPKLEGVAGKPPSAQAELDKVLGGVGEKFKHLGIELEYIGSELESSGLLSPIETLLSAFGLLAQVVEVAVKPFSAVAGVLNEVPGPVKDMIGAFALFKGGQALAASRFGLTAGNFIGRLPGVGDLGLEGRNVISDTVSRYRTRFTPETERRLENAQGTLADSRGNVRAASAASLAAAGNVETAIIGGTGGAKLEALQEEAAAAEDARAQAIRRAAADEVKVTDLTARLVSEKALIEVLTSNQLSTQEKLNLIYSEQYAVAGETLDAQKASLKAEVDRLTTIGAAPEAALARSAGAAAVTSAAPVVAAERETTTALRSGGEGGVILPAGLGDASGRVASDFQAASPAEQLAVAGALAEAEQGGVVGSALTSQAPPGFSEPGAATGRLPLFAPGGFKETAVSRAQGALWATPGGAGGGFAGPLGLAFGASVAGSVAPGLSPVTKAVEYGAGAVAAGRFLAPKLTGFAADALSGSEAAGGAIAGAVEGGAGAAAGVAGAGLAALGTAGLAGLAGVGLGATTGGAGGLAEGVAGGALTGATVGSIFPVVGTAAGAVIGGVVGGASHFIGNQVLGVGDSPGLQAAKERANALTSIQAKISGIAANPGAVNDYQQVFGEQLTSAFTNVGSQQDQQTAQASVQAAVRKTSQLLKETGATTEPGQTANARLSDAVSAAVGSTTFASDPYDVGQIVDTATTAQNAATDTQFKYQTATAASPAGNEKALADQVAADQANYQADFNTAIGSAKASIEDTQNALKTATNPQNIAKLKSDLAGYQQTLRLASGAAQQAKQASTEAEQANAATTYQAVSQSLTNTSSLAIAQAGGNKVLADAATLAGARAQLASTTTSPAFQAQSPADQQKLLAADQAAVLNAQVAQAQQGATELQSKGTLASSTIPSFTPVQQARQALTNATKYYDYVRANANAFDPADITAALAARNTAYLAVSDANYQYNTSLFSAREQLTVAQHPNDALAAAQAQVTQGQQDLGAARSTPERLAAQTQIQTGLNAAHDARLSRVKEQGDLAQALDAGNSVAIAQSAQNTARAELAAARNIGEQLVAEKDLAAANTQYHLALVARADVGFQTSQIEATGNARRQASIAGQAASYDVSQARGPDVRAAALEAQAQAAVQAHQADLQYIAAQGQLGQARAGGNQVAQAQIAVQTAEKTLAAARGVDEQIAAETQLATANTQLRQAEISRTQALAQLGETGATGNAVAQAQIALAAAHHDAGIAKGPDEKIAAAQQVAAAQVQLHQATLQSIGAYGGLVEAVDQGDPVAAAAVAIQVAQVTLANSKGIDEQVAAATTLANAQYQYHQALEAAIGNYGALAASTTRDPLLQLQDQISAARRQLASATTGAEVVQYQTSLNGLLNQYADASLSQSEATVNFQLQMRQITTQQAITQLQGLLRQTGNVAEQQQLLEQIRTLQLGTSGTGGFDLAPGNIKLPTVYDASRIAGALGGTGTIAPNVADHSQTQINVYVANGGDVPAVADAIDRATSSTLAAQLRAAGVT